MIRKQIFVKDGQNAALKRMAQETGKSEGQIIREAIDQRIAANEEQASVWNALLDRWTHQSAIGARDWQRDDLYHDRTRRFDGHAD